MPPQRTSGRRAPSGSPPRQANRPQRVSPATEGGPQRIAKLLARAGIASRRDIERMIAEGRIAIELGPPLASPPLRNLREDLKRTTQLLTDRVEAAVRRHPDQYLWVQKRWKDYHPDLYPGYRSRKEYLVE